MLARPVRPSTEFRLIPMLIRDNMARRRI